MTLIEMLERNAKRSPEKTAIIYSDIKITYKELNEYTNKLAYSLIDIGFKKGDRVGFMLPRVPELVISFLSVAKAQGIAVPINFELSEETIRIILNDISPKCLIVHDNFYDLAMRSFPIASEIPVITVGDINKDFFFWELLKGKNSDNPSLEIKEDEVVYINYTSGSTGYPKGAITTHANIYWNTLASVNALQLTTEDIHLCMFAPFAHPHEIFARPLYLDGTTVLVDKIYPKSIAKAISKHKVTCMMGLAPMYENLLDVLEHKPYDLSSLRVPESGGMYTRTELINRFEQKVGVPIIPAWGSTETTGIAIANTPETIIPDSVGKPCMSYEVKIVDEYGVEVPIGEIGEMIFKGPAIVQGYYKDAINTQSCLKDGWYYSGDLGKRDEGNNFYFIDRKTGMMKVAGLKVYPLEIELALAEHPGVEEVAVISIRDKLRGEVPKAIIVTRNGKEITEKEILEFCREKMPNYKVPRIVEFRKSLPKIGSGKINKKELQMEEV